MGSLVPPDLPVAGTHVCTKRLHIYLSWPTSTEFIHWLDYRKFHLALVCIMHVIRLASASSRCCWCCCCCRFCRCARGIVHLNNINKNEHTHTHRQMQSSPLQTKRSAFSRDFMRTPVNIYILLHSPYTVSDRLPDAAWIKWNFSPLISYPIQYTHKRLYMLCALRTRSSLMATAFYFQSRTRRGAQSICAQSMCTWTAMRSIYSRANATCTHSPGRYESIWIMVRSFIYLNCMRFLCTCNNCDDL